MEIVKYTDSNWHTKIKKALNSDLNTHRNVEQKLYFEHELPIVLKVLNNTEFKLVATTGNNAFYQLKTLKLDDMEEIKKLGKNTTFRKYMVRHHINSYLDGVLTEMANFEPSIVRSAEFALLSNFQGMLYQSLSNGTPEVSKPLSPSEVNLFIKDIQENGKKNTKIEFATKEQIIWGEK